MRKTPLENWILAKINCNKNNLSRKQIRDCIEKYQLQKLKQTINYVKQNSSFYKKHLKEFCTEDINSFEDFREMPFTNADQIKNNSLKFVCVSQSDIDRIISLNTSGTSGVPKRIYFTNEDQKLTIDFFEHGMKCLVKNGDRVLILLSGKAPGGIGNLLQIALHNIGINSYIYGSMDDVQNTAEFIEQNDINCIVGVPIQVLKLKRNASSVFGKYIEKVLLSTDYVPDVVINELSLSKCKVFTHYGMTEMGFGGGVECEALNGYHMRETDLYFEVVDPKTNRNVTDGNYGEIVFTTLTRKGMPLVRYRTGDIGRFIDEPCRCGTILKTMERIRGRIENSVNLFEDKFLNMRDLDEILFKRKEISNYEGVVDNSKTKFVYDVIVKLEMNENAFKNIKYSIFNDLYNIPVVREGNKRSIVNLIIQNCDTNVEIKKSNLKRKINDLRNRRK